MRTENINFDKLFVIDTKKEYSGRFQDAVELITKIQLKDPSKWALFVSQFKNGVDGIVDGRGWRGEYWGKMMRGASMIYRYTQDKELYDILEATVIDMMSAQDVVDILAIPLIGIVPDDENVVIATNQGEPLVGSNTYAGVAYMNITKRVTGQEVPPMEFPKTVTFWARFSDIFKKKQEV